MVLAATASNVAPAVTIALLTRPVKNPRHWDERSTKCFSVGANVRRGGTAKISALGLTAETTMNAIGTSDQASALPMTATARARRNDQGCPLRRLPGSLS